MSPRRKYPKGEGRTATAEKRSVARAKLKRGDRLHWMDCRGYVIRVAKDGSWADIMWLDPLRDAPWTKRQKLPLPDSVTFVFSPLTKKEKS